MSVEIEFDLSSNAVPDYAMYTELGNAGVHGIVVAAKLNNWTWVETQNALRSLAESNEDVFGEALDTAVRECVFSALDFANKNQSFYAY